MTAYFREMLLVTFIIAVLVLFALVWLYYALKKEGYRARQLANTVERYKVTLNLVRDACAKERYDEIPGILDWFDKNLAEQEHRNQSSINSQDAP